MGKTVFYWFKEENKAFHNRLGFEEKRPTRFKGFRVMPLPHVISKIYAELNKQTKKPQTIQLKMGKRPE